MARISISAIVCVALIVLLGCVSQASYEQKIAGIILKDGKGVKSIRVGFTSVVSESGPENGVETTTNDEGQFLLKQVYTPLPAEKHAVVIHPYRLWIFVDGRWRSVWKLKSGPAPTSLDFRCTINDINSVECLASWNNQNFK